MSNSPAGIRASLMPIELVVIAAGLAPEAGVQVAASARASPAGLETFVVPFSVVPGPKRVIRKVPRTAAPRRASGPSVKAAILDLDDRRSGVDVVFSGSRD